MRKHSFVRKRRAKTMKDAGENSQRAGLGHFAMSAWVFERGLLLNAPRLPSRGPCQIFTAHVSRRDRLCSLPRADEIHFTVLRRAKSVSPHNFWIFSVGQVWVQSRSDLPTIQIAEVQLVPNWRGAGGMLRLFASRHLAPSRMSAVLVYGVYLVYLCILLMANFLWIRGQGE